MTICSIHQISKMFGGNKIFENLSFEIQEKARIGLVGRNGSGKTTIFKLMATIEIPDEGEIHMKKGARVGYLAQIPQYPLGTTGLHVLQIAFTDKMKTAVRLRELEESMAMETDDVKLAKNIEEYGRLQDEFILSGGYEMEANIAKVANGLGITDLLQRDFGELSGGEKTKVCLGLVLLQNPDLLLLDEPTNHLDIAAVEWLEEFLKEYEGTIVCISHDRYFLDNVVTKVFDLEDGEVAVYHTNYSGFVKEKEERLLQEFQAYQEQQKKIKKMKEAIKRLKEWANQANPPNEGLHKQARNMERALERMEKLKRPVLERKQIGLEFEKTDRSGKEVFIMKDVSKSYGEKELFRKANLLVHYLDRAAIVGPNGTGKSTIIKMVLQEVMPDSGELKLGSNVKIGYLSQHFNAADPNMRLIDAFREEVHVAEGEARHILAKFLFYGANVFRKVGQLSGGEKMRLRLAQLMYQDVNFLVLDEPTNHLDIDSREVLEEALEEFKGTILAVSHDRYFLNKLFKRTYWLHNQKLYSFEGGYSWAKDKLEEMQARVAVPETARPTQKAVKQRLPEQKDEIKKLDEVESVLIGVEEKLAALEIKMLEEKDLAKLQEIFSYKEKLEQEKEELYEQLEGLI
ncbi:ABC transporter ATP-binding protein [Bacillus sp. FJAT-27225]|uniref:ribosomal protection-like ABC-F family protein n=1 Tax=Bacillus sp. FJAT-27225 TaxID=1743144 RepID=UPI00080C3514|nr:ABC-F type ribosomal protection protein [Bacillus sp. FJAT-27225]OCA91467.1 ABC transporter ATP-binding protein [Bacillus sp. FJAT-27225]